MSDRPATVSRPAAAGARGLAFYERLLTGRAVVAIWLAYALVNALLRAAFSSSLSTDDSLSSFLAQSFQFGYQRGQPPLWEWLLVAVQQALGPGIASHLVLRYGMIALIGIAVYRASLAVSGSEHWSAAMSLSYPLVYQLGWPLFEWGTQTLVLLAACLFTLEVALRHAERPNLRSAAILGVLLGIGFLSKFAFGLFVAALVPALVMRPQTRHGVLHRTTVLSALIAVAVVSPYLVWLVQNSVDLGDVVRQRMVATGVPHLARTLTGLWQFLKGLPGATAPWIVVIGVSWWLGRHAGRARTAAATFERIARDTALLMLVLFVAGIVVLGIDRIAGGHLLVIAVPLLPWGAALLARTVPPKGANALAGLSAMVLVGLTLGRLFALSNGGMTQDAQMGMLWPYQGLARAIEQRGLGQGTLVTASYRDAGNLRAFLPQARTRVLGAEKVALPPRPGHERTCALVLQDARALPAGARWVERNAVDAGALIAGRSREAIDVPWPPTLIGKRRTSRWLLIRLDPQQANCR
jgi:hypothetical protein